MICFSPIRTIEHIEQLNHFTLFISVFDIKPESSNELSWHIFPVTQNCFISELLVRLHVLHIRSKL